MTRTDLESHAACHMNIDKARQELADLRARERVTFEAARAAAAAWLRHQAKHAGGKYRQQGVELAADWLDPSTTAHPWMSGSTRTHEYLVPQVKAHIAHLQAWVDDERADAVIIGSLALGFMSDLRAVTGGKA